MAGLSDGTVDFASGVTVTTIPPTGASATQVQGNVADGAAAVGGPVQVGGVDGSGNVQALLVDTTGRLITSEAPASVGTMSSVAASASAVTVLAANASRLGATVVNDSAAILYLGLSATTPTNALYTVAIQPTGTVGSYYEVPFRYTGIIRGIWASATGNARVTELTA